MESTARTRLAISLVLLAASLGVAPHAPGAAAGPGVTFPTGLPGSNRGIVFASRREPRTGREWYAKGMDRHGDRRYDEAIEAFRKAIERGYREDAASYNIACGYALKGDADHAFEWLNRAVDSGFDLAAYLEEDDDLESLQKDPRFAELETRLHAEKADRHGSDRQKALARFERLQAQPPKGGADFYDVGGDLLDASEFDKAAAAFQASADRGHRAAASLYNIACAQSRKGDKTAALDSLSRALEAGFDDPHHLDVDDDLDNIRHESRFRELRNDADDLELPGALDGWWTRFVGEMFGPDWHERAHRYRAYIKAHRDSGRAWFNLGFAELRLDHPKIGRDAFQKALELGYRKPTTMYNLACSYALLDQRDPAFDWLFKALDAGFRPNGRLWLDPDLSSLRGDSRFRKARRVAEERRERED